MEEREGLCLITNRLSEVIMHSMIQNSLFPCPSPPPGVLSKAESCPDQRVSNAYRRAKRDVHDVDVALTAATLSKFYE